MESDIVLRLRFWSDQAKEQDVTDVVIGLCQAADEIERLRETVDGYRRDLFKKVAEVQQLRAELRTYTGDGHTLGEHLAREAT